MLSLSIDTSAQQHCLHYSKTTLTKTDITVKKNTVACFSPKNDYVIIDQAFYTVTEIKMDKSKDWLHLKATKQGVRYYFLLDHNGQLFTTSDETEAVLMLHN